MGVNFYEKAIEIIGPLPLQFEIIYAIGALLLIIGVILIILSPIIIMKCLN